MAKVKVFIDSDVITSSLLSQTGASNVIVNNTDLNAFISHFSHEELNRTVNKLGIDKNKLQKLLRSKLRTIRVNLDKEEVLDKFGKYTYDIEDTHIVAGAKILRNRFLTFVFQFFQKF